MKLSTAPTGPFPSPFDAVAESYDEVFTESVIGRAQRRLVWEEVDRHFHAGQRILELNCGTGVDALHLAQRGARVLGCDSSSRMIDVAIRRVLSAGMGERVDLRVLATEGIARLEAEGPFDGALSNFGGLNCVEDLSSVARDLKRLLKPGGRALLCFFGPCCLWEILWYFADGDFRKALRRLSRQGTQAHLGGNSTVQIQYPSVRTLEGLFAPHFRLGGWKSIGVAIPPSYLEFLAVRFPRLFRATKSIEPWLGRCPVLRGTADHILLTFERVRT